MIRVSATLDQLGQAQDDGIDVTVTGTDQATGDQVTFVLDWYVYAVQCGGLLSGEGAITFDIQAGQGPLGRRHCGTRSTLHAQVAERSARYQRASRRTREVNARQPTDEKVNGRLSASLLSRTATVPGWLATSMQLDWPLE